MAFVDLFVVALFVVVAVLLVQRGRAGAASTSDDGQRLRDDVDQLRARIQVLERVITDTHGSADLSSEIERLRDR